MLKSLGYWKNFKIIDQFDDEKQLKSSKLRRSAMIMENLKGIKNIAIALNSNLDSGIQHKDGEDEIKNSKT